MDFYRIQDKIISWEKVERNLQKALMLRSRGFSQQEVADRLKMDRTFISRLETIGELRKGQSIACIGFPVLNKEEINEILEKQGVDFIFLMTEIERREYANSRNGNQMLNELMAIISQIRNYEVVILIGSDKRLRLLEGMIDSQVISIVIGTSPITEDKWVDPEELQKVLRMIKDAR
ncbi:hypothetical protein ASZ90_017596 [hydrocarbon metagenome]|uniref:HTH cro/C1-type domain-containing protein n=1 Tax=hydrocarbon metagenome TaxID=938273 RepID=A0A0W8E8M9_9ZZZZ